MGNAHQQENHQQTGQKTQAERNQKSRAVCLFLHCWRARRWRWFFGQQSARRQLDKLRDFKLFRGGTPAPGRQGPDGVR